MVSLLSTKTLLLCFTLLDLKHLMKHEKHVQKRKRAVGESTVPPTQPTFRPPTIQLPSPEVLNTTPVTSYRPMVVRPSASFYPSCPEYLINFHKVFLLL